MLQGKIIDIQRAVYFAIHRFWLSYCDYQISVDNRKRMLKIETVYVIILRLFMQAGEQKMARSYNKLWKLMIDKKMNKTQLRTAAKVSSNAMAKLGRDESVSIETLEKICSVLQCDIGDITEFIPEEDSDE